MQILLAVVLGFFLDLLLGDPRWLPHPVVAIGKLISLGERGLRRLFPATPRWERLGGVLLVALVLAVTGGVGYTLLWLADQIHWVLSLALQTFWSYQCLACRCLGQEASKVQQALACGTLDDARRAVSGLVGRDTERLSDHGVARAAVETVAENTTDGVVAPLFYLMIGGAGLGLLYKAVNTMDSMVGYRNDRYRFFGTAAARLDDVCNYLPARIAALLMIAAAPLSGLDGRGAWRIWRRDRRKHKSPNSAQTEAVCAGALGVELAGDAAYFGRLVHKPAIGDARRPIAPEDIGRACHLMCIASSLALLLFGAARLVAALLCQAPGF